MLDCQVPESLIWLRYFERPPTVGLIDISLSLRTIRSWVLRWPMSLRASRLRPLVIAASPTTTAIRSVPWRRSRAVARPCPIDSPVPAWPPSKTSCSRLAPAREAADPAELAQRPEPLEAAGQELVRIGLVAGVPDDPVARRLEQPMERDRQLDDAEAAARWPPVVATVAMIVVADLGGELLELGLGEAAQVGGAGQGREDRGWSRGRVLQDRRGSVGEWSLVGRIRAATLRGSARAIVNVFIGRRTFRGPRSRP